MQTTTYSIISDHLGSVRLITEVDGATPKGHIWVYRGEDGSVSAADAIGYALRQWDALCRYTDDGSLEIDNNGAENALRPLCLGRKNWLFIGSEAAAHRTMVLLTLVQTCKAHHVDPFAYLRDVIDRVSTHPMSRIDELTPRRWKEFRQQPTDSQAA